MRSQTFIADLLQAASARRDLVIVVLIVTAISAMILPITPLIADALIAVNIGLSVLLLMVAFYVHSPVDFSALPAIILITTVFRLSISIAATRLILIEADGGQIVQTFGDFVISGNAVVGLVIFVIITIVQFLVITKGSERVAEVAARFSLDGLPGKQMSIDSDLRNGDIDQSEAKRRRQSLEKESQLYGAMDGAMKFVKGDAIAGIIIIAVNLFGGMAVGMIQRGLSFSESTHVFSLLTIGEGLVSQIPAIFISLTAGTIVTRVTTGTSQNLGADIISQIAARPEALRLASGVLLGLSLVPGFPSGIFIIFAVALGATGTMIIRKEKLRVSRGEFGSLALGPAEVSALLPPPMAAPVTVLISPDLYADLQSQDMGQKLRVLAHDMADDLGFTTPSIAYRVEQRFSKHRYVIEVDMVPETARAIDFDLLYAPASSAAAIRSAGLNPVPVATKAGPPIVAIKKSDYQGSENAELALLRAPQLLEADVKDLLRRNAAHFLGLQETRRLLSSMEVEYKDLLREVQRIAPIQRIADVLRRLLEEGVPIRNMRLILETILEWGSREQDIISLTNHVRSALKRQICFRVADENNVISALVIERQAEDAMRKAAQEAAARNQQALDAEFIAGFRDVLRAKAAGIAPADLQGAVILVSPDLRRMLWTILSKAEFLYPVLSYQEIAPDFTIRTLTTIGPPAKKATFTQAPQDVSRAQGLVPKIAYEPDVT